MENDQLSPSSLLGFNPASSAPSDVFANGGEMGELMRATDWSKTRLGPVESWPKSLRTMLGVVLGSRFPMCLWWGPELLHVYNDAYRPILRDKHPASLGAPAAEVWAEVWDLAGPMARGVQSGGPATWTEDLQLFINSGSMAEETYFTFSYSPVPGDDGRVGGVLNTVQETTAKVQGERQIRMLHDLAARSAEARSIDEAVRLSVDVLSANELDLPFALIYRSSDDSDEATLTGCTGWSSLRSQIGSPEACVSITSRTARWPFAEVLRTKKEVVVDDLRARFADVPLGRWNASPERATILPLARAGRASPYGFLVAGISPHRELDTRYRRFFQATADQVANAVANADTNEAEIKRADALAEIDRAKTAFFSNVSHEFRTPLTLILGHLEEAREHAPASLRGNELEAVHRGALRLLRLVNSLLDFARIEAGRFEPSVVAVDLPLLTNDLASSFRSLIERAGLKYTVACAPMAQPVNLDPSHWEKIVLNLISNAFKFTFAGEIAVTLRADEARVELVVRDSGIGIPARELPRMFERFHRIEGARGRTFEGTGIGLSLVRDLARLRGGDVTVQSEEGVGTTFMVSIPKDHSTAAVSQGAPVRRAASDLNRAAHLNEAARWSVDAHDGSALDIAPDRDVASDAEHRTRGAEARVLVADDNADMRDYLARLLSSRWVVETAVDGQAALELAQANPPDLVLSDVMMPRLDGVELLRALRADSKTSHIPVVLLSARAGEEAILQGLDTGADDYLVKPFAARELLARVQTHLELARLRRTWAQELERANQELEAFSYSVSHDLRAPLRAIDGFSKILIDDHAAKLDPDGRHCVERVRAGTQRMALLIDDLLGLSRISRASIRRERVDLSTLVSQLFAELAAREPERVVDARVESDLTIVADARLMRVALDNLIGNAWKYTSKCATATIVVGVQRDGAEPVFFVRDNGAGFDMAYANKLFAPFQRLHSQAEFEGTGIGLATVQRIVARHGGRVWAESSVGGGATFYFTLGGA